MSTIGRIARMTGQWIPAALARPFGAPTAVFFHGVEAQITDARIQINQHSLDAFEDFARLLKRDFDVLPLTALSDVLKQPEKYSRALFLMSDDGYANTLTTAAPALEAFTLPWTLFVSTHHIDTGEFTPPTLTRAFFREIPDGIYEIPCFERLSVWGTQSERDALADKAWDRLKLLNGPRGQEAINAMTLALRAAGIDLRQRFLSEALLNWDQVRELHNRGVEIGAHADRHWAMHESQPADWMRDQTVRPKLRIEQEVGPCRFFAYPFGNRGDVGSAAWQAVRDAGYDAAFTTMAGTLDAGTNNWLLPRYGLAPKESNLAAFLPVLRTNNARLRQWQSQIGT